MPAPGVAVELGGVAVEPLGVALVCATARLPANIIPPIAISFAFIRTVVVGGQLSVVGPPGFEPGTKGL